MAKEEKYTKNLEWLVEHLKFDLEKTQSEVERLKKEAELKAVIEQAISKIDQISRKIEEIASSRRLKREMKPKARRFNYKKFIEEKLIGREAFTLKEIREEFKLPKYKAHTLAEKIKKEYADKFTVTKDREGIKFKALSK
ncbi:MAG: hypothetical protein QXJ68_06875 [Methanocellales archaeon]